MREDLQIIQQWAGEHLLGEPIAVHCETYASYREKADWNWYDDPAKCPVAPLFRLSVYMLNDLVALFGGVESVNVMTSRRFTERPSPDNASALLRFKNGMLASLFASFCIDDAEPYQDSMVLHFERGTIYKNMMRAARDLTEREDSRETVLDLVFSGEGSRRILQKRVTVAGGGYPWEHLHKIISTGDFSSSSEPTKVAEALYSIAALQRAEASGNTEKVLNPAK